MRITKSVIVCILLLTTMKTTAQYKKASFFEKDGRTYEIGGTTHLLGKGRSAQQGVSLSFGRETSKRVFFWYDFELLFPSTFTTIGIVNYTQEVQTITGKSKLGFILRYNWGYFLTDNNKEENKILPLLNVGFNYKMAGSGLTLDPAYLSTNYENFTIPDNSGSVGVNFGGGAILTLNKSFSVKFLGGYNLQITKSTFNPITTVDKQEEYESYISHPYVSIGIRFKVSKDDE
jgi:hypothetical protein